MLFSETGIGAHFYLFVASIVLLVSFMIYVYCCEHKVEISNSEIEKIFKEQLGKEFEHITHDDKVWYYKGISTCVGYGNENEYCSGNESYCSGENNTFGTHLQQALQVKEALRNNYEHKLCPLIYSGTN